MLPVSPLHTVRGGLSPQQRREKEREDVDQHPERLQGKGVRFSESPGEKNKERWEVSPTTKPRPARDHATQILWVAFALHVHHPVHTQAPYKAQPNPIETPEHRVRRMPPKNM